MEFAVKLHVVSRGVSTSRDRNAVGCGIIYWTVHLDGQKDVNPLHVRDRSRSMEGMARTRCRGEC